MNMYPTPLTDRQQRQAIIDAVQIVHEITSGETTLASVLDYVNVNHEPTDALFVGYAIRLLLDAGLVVVSQVNPEARESIPPTSHHEPARNCGLSCVECGKSIDKGDNIAEYGDGVYCVECDGALLSDAFDRTGVDHGPASDDVSDSMAYSAPAGWDSV